MLGSLAAFRLTLAVFFLCRSALGQDLIGQLYEPAVLNATVLDEITAGDATQGCAVGPDHVYAVTNSRITKLDKSSGEPLLQFDATIASEPGPILHMDRCDLV